MMDDGDGFCPDPAACPRRRLWLRPGRMRTEDGDGLAVEVHVTVVVRDTGTIGHAGARGQIEVPGPTTFDGGPGESPRIQSPAVFWVHRATILGAGDLPPAVVFNLGLAIVLGRLTTKDSLHPFAKGHGQL